MARIIFLRVGQKDRVPLLTFINSLQSFLGILRDLDATISKDQHGSVVWEVVSLEQKSPPIVGVSPAPKPDVQDFSAAVEAQVFENTTLLRTTTEPTQFMSYAALKNLEKLAEKTRHIGSLSVYVAGEGIQKRESDITERTLENVQQLTGVRYSGYGSIVGGLDSIYVHNANEFRVWDETTGKPVRCKFEVNQEEQIKSLLRHRVVVTGTIKSNRIGLPIAMDVEGVEPFTKHTLPTIEEMSGSMPGITEGKPLKQYLDEIGDD